MTSGTVSSTPTSNLDLVMDRVQFLQDHPDQAPGSGSGERVSGGHSLHAHKDTGERAFLIGNFSEFLGSSFS